FRERGVVLGGKKFVSREITAQPFPACSARRDHWHCENFRDTPPAWFEGSRMPLGEAQCAPSVWARAQIGSASERAGFWRAGLVLKFSMVSAPSSSAQRAFPAVARDPKHIVHLRSAQHAFSAVARSETKLWFDIRDSSVARSLKWTVQLRHSRQRSH